MRYRHQEVHEGRKYGGKRAASSVTLTVHKHILDKNLLNDNDSFRISFYFYIIMPRIQRVL